MEAKLSATEIFGVEEGEREEYFWYSSSRFARGDWGCHLSVDEETGLE